MDAHKNFAYSLVATAPSPAASGTSLTVTAGGGALFPTVPFNATVWPIDALPLASNGEIVRVTNIAGDVLTITRAQESSSARTIIVGDQIAATITNKVLTDIESAVAAGGLTNINVSAGATSNNLSALTFSNSNGISFGLTGSVITGTVATNYQSAGAYLTTAGLSQDSSKYAGTAGAITNGSITVNTAGVSVNLPAYLTTAMQSNAATISNIRVSAGSTSNLLSAVTFSNSNGVSFGLDGSTVTATVKTDYQTAGAYLTTAMLSNAATISNIRVSAGAASNNLSAVTFADSNGISFGLNGSVITGTVATNYQSAGAYLTTAALSQDSSKYAGTAGAITGGSITVNTDGVSVNLPAYLTTAMLSDAATISNVNVSAGTTSNNLSAMVFSNSNGVSFGLNGSTVTAGVNFVSFFAPPSAVLASNTQLNGASVSMAAAFVVPLPLSASFLRIPVSMTTNSTTIATTGSSANASAAIYNTWNAVVYSNGIGASSRSLMSVASGSAQNTFMNSISVETNGTQYSVTQGFSHYVEGGGATLTTQWSISNTNYSLSTNAIATNFSGLRFIDINFANSLAAGAYWIVMGYSSSSATNSALFSAMTNCNVKFSQHYGNVQTNNAWGIMGSTNFTSGGLLGAGSFSTAGGGTTNSLPLSAISSGTQQHLMYFQAIRSA